MAGETGSSMDKDKGDRHILLKVFEILNKLKLRKIFKEKRKLLPPPACNRCGRVTQNKHIVYKYFLYWFNTLSI